MCVLSPPSSEDQVSNHKLTQATEWDTKSYPGKVVGRVRFLSWLASGVPLMDSGPETLISTTDHFIKALEAFRDGAQLVAAAHSRSGSLKLLFLACFVCFWIRHKRILSHHMLLPQSNSSHQQGLIGHCSGGGGGNRFHLHQGCLTPMRSPSTEEPVALDFLQFLASPFYKKRGLLDLRVRLQDSCAKSSWCTESLQILYLSWKCSFHLPFPCTEQTFLKLNSGLPSKYMFFLKSDFACVSVWNLIEIPGRKKGERTMFCRKERSLRGREVTRLLSGNIYGDRI